MDTDTHTNTNIKDTQNPASADEYARSAFTLRRAKRSQIIGLIVALVAMILGFVWLEVGAA